MFKIFYLLLLNVVFFTNIFAQTPAQPARYGIKTTNISVTENDPMFVIRLKSNPTTGYSWSLGDYDQRLITNIGHDYQKSDKKLMGAGGMEVWSFKVNPEAFAKPQKINLPLIYMRPWEGPTKGIKINFTITPQVRNKH